MAARNNIIAMATSDRIYGQITKDVVVIIVNYGRNGSSKFYFLFILLPSQPSLLTSHSNSAFDNMEARLRLGKRNSNTRYNLRTEYMPRARYLDTTWSRHE